MNFEDFDSLLDLRERYKVSTEALLLRMSRLCGLSIFAASFGENRKEPMINYSISGVNETNLVPGTYLSTGSVIADCTAIGFTASGMEKWPRVGPVHIQCVGVPPYPGQLRPRVLGVFRAADALPARRPMIDYVRGDATQPRGKGQKIIVQMVNDKAITWGGGLSLAVRRKWPKAQKEYSHWATEGSRNRRLGSVHFSHPADDISVASVVAQAGYGPSARPRIRYGALEDGLVNVAQRAREIGASIHMPRLGCGEAGGVWNIVSELIETNVVSSGIPVTVYDLPAKGAPSKAGSQLGLFVR
jgi:O-acetyl-ADP-ribose deacetylase (regulator of RNase III)